jgi:hypothetical protein
MTASDLDRLTRAVYRRNGDAFSDLMAAFFIPAKAEAWAAEQNAKFRLGLFQVRPFCWWEREPELCRLRAAVWLPVEPEVRYLTAAFFSVKQAQDWAVRTSDAFLAEELPADWWATITGRG